MGWDVLWCDVMHCSSPLFCDFSFLFLLLLLFFLLFFLSVALPSSFLFLFLLTYCYSSFLWLFPLRSCYSYLFLSVTLPFVTLPSCFLWLFPPVSFLLLFRSVTFPLCSSSFPWLFPLPFPSVALPFYDFFPLCSFSFQFSWCLKVRNSEVSGLNFFENQGLTCKDFGVAFSLEIGTPMPAANVHAWDPCMYFVIHYQVPWFHDHVTFQFFLRLNFEAQKVILKFNEACKRFYKGWAFSAKIYLKEPSCSHSGPSFSVGLWDVLFTFARCVCFFGDFHFVPD